MKRFYEIMGLILLVACIVFKTNGLDVTELFMACLFMFLMGEIQTLKKHNQ